ncbi:MAG: M48 family metalloprotease [Gemmatimonadetes bacterium]|nr:M48 family metalloprotease [Gemmatimonadota bacterium]
MGHSVIRLARSVVPCLLLCTSACAVSTQQEVEIGTNYASQIAKELPLIQDAEVNRYITTLGLSLARVADQRNLDWHFHVVDSKEVNAFAVPGGYIYVNRGLIERATNMSQVAGVLGHEIGHVTRRHSVKQMQKAQGTNIGATLLCTLTAACNSGLAQTAAQIGASAAFAKFSRTDEAEADDEGLRYVVKAGIDPNGIPEMFEILEKERKEKPTSMDLWFASHPMEESRIADTRAAIAKLPPDQLKGLVKDTKEFQAFKKRVMALPAPPPTKK